MFSKIQADRLLLEYDDERSGSFAALRHVNEKAVVVLGLVGTKTPATPSRKELERRIREAGQVLPKERLAISTQCGFSTSIVGNRISVADQEAKLRRVVETARSMWG